MSEISNFCKDVLWMFSPPIIFSFLPLFFFLVTTPIFLFHQEGKNQILFVAKNISVTSAYYFRNDWKDSQSQSGYVHGIINLEKPLQLLLDIPLFIIFSKPSKHNRNMFENILLLELFILIWLSQKNIFWSIKWPLKVLWKKWEKKTKTIFFFATPSSLFS